MKNEEDPPPRGQPTPEQPGWMPPLWTPDGHNYIPTSGKAWVVVITVAIVLGVLASWL